MKSILPIVLLALLPRLLAADVIETFNSSDADNQVLFRADAIYSADGVTPSGGNINGNASTLNGFVVEDNDFAPFSTQGFGLINQDQSGVGNFLYNGTNNGSAPDYVGLVWGSQQPVAVSTNTDYILSFYLTNSNDLNTAIIQPSINGTDLVGQAEAMGFFSDGVQGNGWQRFEFQWFSDTSTIASIDLRNLRANGSGNDFGLDTISLTAVPEPSTASFIFCASLLAIITNRRRSDKSTK